MAAFSRAIERLYHTPMVGRAFSTLGSLLRVVQWRVEHATRIAEQSRLIAEHAAAAAAREAALAARIDELTQSLQVQAAMTSTVQRLAREEFEKTRQASVSAIAAKDDLQSSLADLLNAATLNDVNTKALRDELQAARAAAAAQQESMTRALEALETRMEERLDQQIRRIDEASQRNEALKALSDDITALRRDQASASERIDRAQAIATAARDELWQRAGGLEGELSKRAVQLDQAQHALGALNALDIPTQLSALRAALEYLTSRVEFVRRETLLEARYGGAGAQVVEPRIVNAAKVKAMGKALRVNVGCGHITPAEYVNVDQRELPGVDVVAEAGNLPFPPGSVTELYSAHFLEHFPQERLRRQILPYFKSLLKAGGRLRAIVPDAEAMIREYAAGRYSYAELREVTFGGQDYEGDFHYNMFTPESLVALLHEVGFSKVDVPVKGRRNGACYEFEVVAS